MKYIHLLFVIFNMCTFYLYSSHIQTDTASSQRKPINIDTDLWLEKLVLDIRYKQLLRSFKNNEPVNFEPIFKQMESLCQAFPDENNAREVYQEIIEAQKKAVLYP